MKGKILAGSLVLGIAAMGLGAPSLAQQDERKAEEVVERKVIVRHSGKGATAMAHHEPGFARAECTDGEKAESNIVVGEGEDRHRTHIVICTKGGGPAGANAKLAEALAKARTDVGRHGDMSAERKAELRAAIDAEIARVRARN